MNYIPPGYTMQVAPRSFNFDIIIKAQGFQKYQKFAEERFLLEDLTKPDFVPQTTIEYIHIEQKSPIWLKLRAESDGTASSLGKYLFSPRGFPSMDQVQEAWYEKLSHAPFDPNTAAQGHMKYGCLYEDPALVHFVVEHFPEYVAQQVGTIHLPYQYIISLGLKNISEWSALTTYLPETNKDAYLLVSPDGVLRENANSGKLLGIIEIKCCSPFHHVPNEDGTLHWVDNMETRQWHKKEDIPFVYLIQMSLQVISCLHRFTDMNDESIVWFIRWTPNGFSEFRSAFKHLVPVGIIASIMYFRLKTRLTLENLPMTYDKDDKFLHTLLIKYFHQAINSFIYDYVPHETLYPEFKIYRQVTEYFRFTIDTKNTKSDISTKPMKPTDLPNFLT